MALDDGHEVELRVATGEGIRKDVAGGEFNGLLVQVVRQDNETSGELSGSSVQDRIEGLNDVVDTDTRRNVPVVGIEVIAVEGSPDDRGHAHGHGDGTNTVVDVTVWGAHSVGRNTGDLTDGLAGPAKLGNDLLVGEGGERRMRPGVNGQLVTGHVFGLKDVGARDGARTNNEEGRLEVLVSHVVEEIGGVRRRSIVVANTPCQLVGASGDIR